MTLGLPALGGSGSRNAEMPQGLWRLTRIEQRTAECQRREAPGRFVLQGLLKVGTGLVDLAGPRQPPAQLVADRQVVRVAARSLLEDLDLGAVPLLDELFKGGSCLRRI